MNALTFVLVLIVTPSDSYRGVAIDHIPGYASSEACEAAGRSWAEQNQKVSIGRHWRCLPGPQR